MTIYIDTLNGKQIFAQGFKTREQAEQYITQQKAEMPGLCGYLFNIEE